MSDPLAAAICRIQTLVVGICVSLCACQLHAASDTLRRYDVTNGVRAYRVDSNTAIAERFSISSKTNLLGVRLWVTGPVGATARLHVYGNESGSSVPLAQTDLTPHGTIVKQTTAPFESVLVEWEQPLTLLGDQFFVCLDSMSKGFSLMSDNVVVASECVCPTERFVHQCVRRGGVWTTGEYSFLVEPIVEQVSTTSPFRFLPDTLTRQPFGSEKFGIVVADLDADGAAEVVTHGGAWHGGHVLSMMPDLSKIVGNAAALSIRRDKSGATRLVVFNHSTEWRSLERSIDGIPVSIIELPHVETVLATVSADIDADGNDELVVAVREEGGMGRLFILSPDVEPISSRRELGIPSGMYFQSAIAYPTVYGMMTVKVRLTLTDSTGRVFFSDLVVHDEFRFRLSTPISIQSNREAVTVRPTLTLLYNDKGVSALAENLQMVPVASFAALVSDSMRRDQHGVVTVGSSGTSDVVDQAWSSTVEPIDRISAANFRDIDNDGHGELIVATSDPCRSGRLYRKSDHNLVERVYGSGIEWLSGSPDIAWGDINGDGTDDAVGIVGGRLIVLYNRALNQNRASLSIVDDAAVQRSIVYAVSTDERSIVHARMSGRGWDVHERGPIRFTPGEGVDSVRVIQQGVDGITSTSQRVPVTGAQQKSAQNGNCVVTVKPNPFKALTSISLDRENIQTCNVLDQSGRLVWSWASVDNVPITQIQWDGISLAGDMVSSGVYTIVVQTPSCIQAIQVLRIP